MYRVTDIETIKTKKIIIDIETIKNCFLVCGIDAYSDKKFHFVIWKDINDINKLYTFLNYCKKENVVHITYNGLSFDSQILHWLMLNETNKAFMDSRKESTDFLVDKIYNKAQECTKKSFNNEWNEFPEWKLNIPQLDVFKLNHWDNINKLTSLKWLQCSMDWENLEDMPYHHTVDIETKEQLEEVISYCYNDCYATKKIFLLSKEGIELRENLSNEYGLNLRSASEMKMSKELFLHFLSKKLGVNKWELKKFRTKRNEIIVKNIILDYVNFENSEFKAMLNDFKKLKIDGNNLKKAFEYTVVFKGMEINYGVGGVHGFNTSKIYTADENYIIMSSDVKSYYPNLVIRNKWSPAHIQKDSFCEQYEWFYEERIKEPKGSSKNKAWKLLLNGTFGLSIDKNSFLSDSQLGCQITINGQLLLTMLLEKICQNIHEAEPIMLNTDGLEIRIPKNKEGLYIDLCKEWQQLTKLELEHEKYNKLFAFDCNNYIGLFENGTSKCKGRFEFKPYDEYKIEVFHKNKSFLIIRKAVYEYFINGVNPEEFIKKHTNIFDFCGFAKAKGKWKLVKISSTNTGVKEKNIQKILRYYVSSEGSKIIKRHTIDGREIQILAGKNHLTEFNKYVKKEINDYNINYNYYISQVYKEINNLGKKQLDLFEDFV